MDEREGRLSKIAFMFPGQGSYEAGMGREIAEAVPVGKGKADQFSAVKIRNRLIFVFCLS